MTVSITLIGGGIWLPLSRLVGARGYGGAQRSMGCWSEYWRATQYCVGWIDGTTSMAPEVTSSLRPRRARAAYNHHQCTDDIEAHAQGVSVGNANSIDKAIPDADADVRAA